jgi:hypothetical protein
MHHEANDGIKHAAEYYLVVIGQSYVRVNPYQENARTNGRRCTSGMCSQVPLSVTAGGVVNTLDPGGSLQWNCEQRESTHNIERHNNAPERKHWLLLSKTKCKTEAGRKPYSAEQRAIFGERQTIWKPCPTTLHR